MKHFGFFAPRNYVITAHRTDLRFPSLVTDIIVANSLRQAWNLFKQNHSVHKWKFISAKSDTGVFYKIN